MNRFFLITNEEKDPDLSISKKIKNKFEEAGCSCTMASYSRAKGDKALLGYTNPETVPKDTECIISLGGDGTLIQAYRDTRVLDLPILGFNFGTLGFLAEVEPSFIYEAISSLKNGEFTIEERMLLSGNIRTPGSEPRTSFALNDIVVTRNGHLRLMDYNITVNGLPLVNLKADGIIISTPTGSTGYNLSAGGPIVEPSARLMVITPICAHSLRMRSIILSPGDTIVIDPIFKWGGESEGMEASFDGREIFNISPGDAVEIKSDSHSMKMLKLSKDSFMEVLNKKMNWGI